MASTVHRSFTTCESFGHFSYLASGSSEVRQVANRGTPGKVAVLIGTGLVLFLLTFLVNAAARYIITRSDRKFRV
ncbi:MAG: hypothetical protein V9E81_11330 [Marmoricola sp.]